MLFYHLREINMCIPIICLLLHLTTKNPVRLICINVGLMLVHRLRRWPSSSEEGTNEDQIIAFMYKMVGE